MLDRINYVNIGLMLASMVLAFLVPFELFLFVYAVLGPLHYLTEISWLHDRKYFAQSKWDATILVLCGLAITISQYPPFKEVLEPYVANYVFIAFFGALALAFVHNFYLKAVAIIITILASVVADKMQLLLLAFIPTLIHVYVFTGLFILYGALKSKSKSGYLSTLIFLLIPLVFIFVMPGARPIAISEYALKVYPQFEQINFISIDVLNAGSINRENMFDLIYNSNTGVVLMRFIAFAYTYHYLNWFSKTNVIKWHEIPKMRFVFVIVLWIASVALYAYEYKIGFEWLFLLSFLHVLLEFPLNHQSISGIFKEIGLRLGVSSR
jgi:hypothetical protein